MGGVTRGVLVGFAVAVVMMPFAGLHIDHIGLIIYHAIMASLMLALIGMMGGIWADKFDHMAAITNFVITPLAFLSGTFYSIDRLPELGQIIAHFNPFFYMIDGFRSGFIGHSDSEPIIGIVVLATINVILWLCCVRMIKSGYKLKA